jgi:hypothetical protein
MQWLRSVLARFDIRPASRRELHTLRREWWEMQIEWESMLDQLTRVTKRYAQREKAEARRALEDSRPEGTPSPAPPPSSPMDELSHLRRTHFISKASRGKRRGVVPVRESPEPDPPRADEAS